MSSLQVRKPELGGIRSLLTTFFGGGVHFCTIPDPSTDLKVVSPQVKKASFVGRFLQDDEAYDVDGASDLRLCLEHVTTSTLENNKKLFGWWFEIFFMFMPSWGNDPILTNMFQMG